ncbi:MAG: succinate dehydrogenase/fumarate reductase iron-sulfur subunit [Rhodobacteraceae bacterium]|nr:succinate dehydrogenase/fumarate reductase iron-sulfur subunit [Paracoccaceae bacterium]
MLEQSILATSVWRGDAEGGEFQRFEVPRRDSQTVLDVVTHIQQELDPSLAYRFACRVGMCGSCAMMVNGVPRWTCRTHVSKVSGNVSGGGGELQIAPLRNLPVIRDLVVDMAPFFDKWTAAEGVFRPSETRAAPMAKVQPGSPARAAANAGIECINCAVCYAACDVVAGNTDYLGPAALNRAWTLVNDARDGGQAERIDAVSSEGGCHNCHSMGSCAQFCPNALNPTAAIAGLKRETVKAKLGWRR